MRGAQTDDNVYGGCMQRTSFLTLTCKDAAGRVQAAYCPLS